MKTLTVIFLLAAGIFTSARAQYSQGNIELSVIGGIGSYSMTEGLPTSSSGGSPMYAFLSFAPAFYVIDGLAIEPEIRLTTIAPDKGKTAYSLVANLDYTYRQSGDVSPYIRVGYGFADGAQAPVAARESHVNESMNMLNTGFGMKIRLTDHAAIRTELNYRSPLGAGYSFSDMNIEVGLTIFP